MNKPRIIKWDKTPEQDFGTVKVRQLLDTEEVPELSVNWVYKAKLPDKRLSKNECDVAYFILSGTGTCLIDGEKTPVSKGDVVYIPAGQEYLLSEGLETIAACNPRFGGK